MTSVGGIVFEVSLVICLKSFLYIFGMGVGLCIGMVRSNLVLVYFR